jgi:hypothetical protein
MYIYLTLAHLPATLVISSDSGDGEDKKEGQDEERPEAVRSPFRLAEVGEDGDAHVRHWIEGQRKKIWEDSQSRGKDEDFKDSEVGRESSVSSDDNNNKDDDWKPSKVPKVPMKRRKSSRVIPPPKPVPLPVPPNPAGASRACKRKL